MHDDAIALLIVVDWGLLVQLDELYLVLSWLGFDDLVLEKQDNIAGFRFMNFF